jgi:hypothetical protein
MALRLRYEIDSPRRLREHVHIVDGAGYFFFPGAIAPKGALASLEVDFHSGQTALLRGWVWARSAGGGLWLELASAQRCLDKLENSFSRSQVRLATDQLVLAEPERMPALLCRLRDVSDGGARLAVLQADVGGPGRGMRIALPEGGSDGHLLEAFGRVLWAGQGEIGMVWCDDDIGSRRAATRLVQNAQHEWEDARISVHPRGCRCEGGKSPEMQLLG